VREHSIGATLLAFAFALALAAVGPAAAQLSDCSPLNGNSRRICDAAVDGTRAFHPIAGLLVSGGNPVIGTANTLGGLGRFSLTARAKTRRVVTLSESKGAWTSGRR
jgi:hypothetical protein